MPATFEKHGIRFLYPESWSLSEFGEAEEFQEVSLESPDGSIWSVSVFESDASMDQLTESCLEGLKQQYEDLESFQFSGSYNGFEAIGFDADFYCLDFLVTAKNRAVKHNGKTFSFFCQAESREFERNQEVFDAITLSLMSNET